MDLNKCPNLRNAIFKSDQFSKGKNLAVVPRAIATFDNKHPCSYMRMVRLRKPADIRILQGNTVWRFTQYKVQRSGLVLWGNTQKKVEEKIEVINLQGVPKRD